MPACLHVFLCVRVCAHHVQVNRNSALAVSEVGEDTPAAKAGLVPVRVCLAASGCCFLLLSTLFCSHVATNINRDWCSRVSMESGSKMRVSFRCRRCTLRLLTCWAMLSMRARLIISGLHVCSVNC